MGALVVGFSEEGEDSRDRGGGEEPELVQRRVTSQGLPLEP